MIADVVFDAPLAHPYAYAVPDGMRVAPGLRVRARLGSAARVGLVVGVRDEAHAGLRPLEAVVDATPLVDDARLDLIGWIAARSLSSVGSTALGLLPPPAGASVDVLEKSAATDRAASDVDERAAPGELGDADAAAACPERPDGGALRWTPVSRMAASADARVAPAIAAWAGHPELFIGSGRERRVLAELAAWPGGVLVIVPDVAAAARWADWLGKAGAVARLDSGVPEGARAEGWRALAAGAARVAVGTRSALLAPVLHPALLALVDEHEAAHLPPGHPRIHSRDLLLERAAREGARLLLTAATPSVEMWWRAESHRAMRVSGEPAPWPAVTIADTRGILRREPLTPELSRALRETLGHGGRAFLAVSRLASALACEDCGTILRCSPCGLALGYSRAAATLTCRVCGASASPPDTCPACRGRRLSPFGWGAERVEHAVRRRFPRVRVVRYDPEIRGARAEAQRSAAATADVVIGTRAALRLFGRGALGVAGFVSPDQLLRLPDFRAGERMLGFLWAAAERVRPDGVLVIQSQHAAHPAVAAVAAHELGRFYTPELSFRAELGYPPFRRLALITLRGAVGDAAALAVTLTAVLRAEPGLTVYPPTPLRRERVLQIVVKGGDDLPTVLAARLGDLPAGRDGKRRTRGIMNVEVDPVEWRF